MMKTTVHYPISESFKSYLSVGDKITPEIPVGEFKPLEETVSISLSQLLEVSPIKAHQYLKKKIGDKVQIGDILAKRKTFFSSITVRSPIEGKLAEIDLKTGTLYISYFDQRKHKKITLPILGKIKEITKSYIEIEIDGEFFRGIKGQGEDKYGMLKYLGADAVGILEVGSDLEETIIVCGEVKEDALPKLEVIGVAGLVVVKSPKETALSWISVHEETLKKLSTKERKNTWLRPKEKEIIIVD